MEVSTLALSVRVAWWAPAAALLVVLANSLLERAVRVEAA